MAKDKTYKVTLEFDNKDSAHGFFAWWLDSGGDGGGNIDWQTVKRKNYNYMRIKGTGCMIEWIDGEMVIMTPEVEEEYFKQRVELMKLKESFEKEHRNK